MIRSPRTQGLPLNKDKYDELCLVIGHYTDAKRFFVAYLRQVSLWRLLDRNKSFRDYAKVQGLYPKGVNVHLIDQAAFDATDTCVLHRAQP